MPTAQAPNRRPRKPSVLGTQESSLLDFFRTQAAAIEAAQSNGVEQMVFTIRPDAPGAPHVEAKIRTEDALHLWTAVLTGQIVMMEPTPKLARAMKEAIKIKTFYKTKEELFDALERQG